MLTLAVKSQKNRNKNKNKKRSMMLRAISGMAFYNNSKTGNVLINMKFINSLSNSYNVYYCCFYG